MSMEKKTMELIKMRDGAGMRLCSALFFFAYFSILIIENTE